MIICLFFKYITFIVFSSISTFLYHLFGWQFVFVLFYDFYCLSPNIGPVAISMANMPYNSLYTILHHNYALYLTSITTFWPIFLIYCLYDQHKTFLVFCMIFIATCIYFEKIASYKHSINTDENRKNGYKAKKLIFWFVYIFWGFI